MTHKEQALIAIAAALKKVDLHPPSLDKRYLLADLETARDEIVLVEELKRARKANKKGPTHAE
jgi:hypothetical protein